MQLLERAREILKKKKDREVLSTEYLATLSQVDRERVGSLVAAFQKNAPDFWGEKIGILAVGSSVRPEKMRFHPVKDIDLRILNSSPAITQIQIGLIHVILETVYDFAQQERPGFEYLPDFTESKRVVSIKSWDYETRETKRETGPFFLDYNNNDPSFIIKGPEGSLPLHISISASPEDTLQRHLQEERRQKQYFSVLAIIPPGK